MRGLGLYSGGHHRRGSLHGDSDYRPRGASTGLWGRGLRIQKEKIMAELFIGIRSKTRWRGIRGQRSSGGCEMLWAADEVGWQRTDRGQAEESCGKRWGQGGVPLVMNESYRRSAVPEPRRGDEAPKSFECEGGPLPIWRDTCTKHKDSGHAWQTCYHSTSYCMWLSLCTSGWKSRNTSKIRAKLDVKAIKKELDFNFFLCLVINSNIKIPSAFYCWRTKT